MMASRARFLLWMCAFAAAAPAAVGSHAASLQHDIFARPPLEALKPEGAQPVKTVTPALPPPEWKPELRAIITGGGTAMVNVEGRIVQMGQEIDGYRLVEVHQRRATFVKDKVRYTLALGEVRAPGAAAAAPAVAPAPASAPANAAPPAPPTAPGLPVAPPAAAPGLSGIGSVKASDVLSRGPAGAPDSRIPGDERKAGERRGG